MSSQLKVTLGIAGAFILGVLVLVRWMSEEPHSPEILNTAAGDEVEEPPDQLEFDRPGDSRAGRRSGRHEIAAGDSIGVPHEGPSLGELVTIVRCVDAVSGGAIAGAQVFVAANSALGGMPSDRGSTPITVLAELGTEYRTNADGEVQVPRPIAPSRVAAVSGERRAFAALKPPLFDEVVELRLGTARDLVIELRHVDGAPAGDIELWLGTWRHSEPGSGTDREIFDRHVAHARTDPVTGIARFEREYLDTLSSWRDAHRGTLVAQVVSPQDVALEFDIVDQGVPTMRFDLPPMGTIHVETNTTSRTSAGVSTPVSVRPVGGHPVGDVRNAWTTSGVATLDAVAGDYRVEAWLGDLRGLRDAEPTASRAPADHGEVVTIRLEQDWLRVRGRIVDTDGRALPGTMVRFSGLRGHALNHVVADELGGIRIDVPAFDNFEGPAQKSVLFRERRRIGGADRSVAASLDTELARVLGQDGFYEIDLGDLVLTEPRLLVSGVVVDGQGRPIEGVQVDAFPDAENLQSAVSPNVRGISSSKTDALGRFWLPDRRHGDEVGIDEHFVLVASSSTCLSKVPERFRVGDEVRHVVEGFGAIEGRFELKGDHDFEFLRVDYLAEDLWGWGYVQGLSVTRGDGSFRLIVPAGEVSIQLIGTRKRQFLQRDSEELACLERIVAQPFRTTRPVGANPWIVDVAPHVVQVVRPDGSPSWETLELVHPDGGWTRARVHDGELTVHGTQARVDAWIGGEDSMYQYVTDLRSRSSIQLEPATTVDVLVDLGSGQLPTGCRIGVQLEVPVPHRAGSKLETAVAWTASGPKLLARVKQVRFAGEWTARLFLLDEHGANRGAFGSSHPVSVVGGPEEQSVVLHVSSTELAEAAALLADD